MSGPSGRTNTLGSHMAVMCGVSRSRPCALRGRRRQLPSLNALREQGKLSMSETEALFSVLRQSAHPVRRRHRGGVRDAPDRDLCRVNPLAFAAKHGLDEEPIIAAFLQASRLGIFDFVERALPGLRRRTRSGHDAQNDQPRRIRLRVCAAGYEPTLDEWSKSPSL